MAKQKKKKILKVLQLDGGGLKGIIFLAFLVVLEKLTGRTIHDMFDVFIGTSTGGISAAGFAHGYTASTLLGFYFEHGKKIFNKRIGGILNPASWWSGQYKRKYVDELCDKMFNKKMKDLDKIFICTAINMKDNQYTHFFKSYKPKYANYTVAELVKRTYSAPVFFGYYEAKDGLWADGGVGVHNCTLLEAYVECVRLNKADSYYILSCGTGHTTLNYDGKFITKQIKDFVPIARDQAVLAQISIAECLSVNFDRIDITIPAKFNVMDGVKYFKDYEKFGNMIATTEAKHIANKLEKLI